MDKLLNEIDDNKGTMVHEFKETDFKKFFIVGALFAPIEQRIARLIQCRKEAGQFGSDTVIMELNGKLCTYENVCFWEIPEKYQSDLDKLYPSNSKFKSDDEYTICGQYPETGIIIKSKVKENETTPMREVKDGIKTLLSIHH